MATQQANTDNWVFAALGPDERERLLKRGDRVSLTKDQPVARADQRRCEVDFPLDAVVSVVQSTAAAGIHEVATIGRDGIVGLPAFLGADVPPWDLLCQIPGDVLRVPAEALGDIATAPAQTRRVLGLYSQALFVQIARNAACNQLHSMMQRCSRWILLVHRQCGRDEFPLTQQSLAAMMAVRRATVTVTARALQDAGAINYHHGSVRITDATTLKQLTCDCYNAITEAYDALLRA